MHWICFYKFTIFPVNWIIRIRRCIIGKRTIRRILYFCLTKFKTITNIYFLSYPISQIKRKPQNFSIRFLHYPIVTIIISSQSIYNSITPSLKVKRMRMGYSITNRLCQPIGIYPLRNIRFYIFFYLHTRNTRIIK